jgi:hypothetical protein
MKFSGSMVFRLKPTTLSQNIFQKVFKTTNLLLKTQKPDTLKTIVTKF